MRQQNERGLITFFSKFIFLTKDEGNNQDYLYIELNEI